MGKIQIILLPLFAIIISCGSGNIQNINYYKVLTVDTSMFESYNFISLEDYKKDTLILLSLKTKIEDNKKLENIIQENYYKIIFSKKDSLIDAKIGTSFKYIDNLELKYGSKTIWKEGKILPIVYFSDQIDNISIKTK